MLCFRASCWQLISVGAFFILLSLEQIYELGPQSASAAEAPTTVAIDLTKPGKRISPDLFGVFFEDLNYAADGGLYAELVQNRSFEYQAAEQRGWNPLTCWELITRGDGRGSLDIEAGLPLDPKNPHYAVLDVEKVGDGVGVRNAGFDGIVLRQGETYDFSLFARPLYVERRWGGPPIKPQDQFAVQVRLESVGGDLLAEAALSCAGAAWQRLSGELIPTHSDTAARLIILAKTQGGVALDVVSLTPRRTFRDRRNGLRRDLAETIAALKPRFVRFPGGCLVHGNGLANMYRWQDTIGPLEHARSQPNLWGYHQTVGLGYFEYFQFCEDIGAKPLPVVPAGVCCQNSGRTAGTGQEGVAREAMPAYIQEVIELIEWANGPASTPWGAKRAAAGHADSFKLEYLAIGNEDHITPVFEERFRMIRDAVAAKHPEVTIIGTVGPQPDGPDYDNGWRFANELRLAIVDEHYYRPPQWFWNNLRRYDAYNRQRSHVYLGEYAAHESDRRSTLRSALAEAAYMTNLERNGDVVRMASCAPLLAKRGHTQWTPDLIYFTNTGVFPTINYYVQQLFSVHSGDEYLTASTRKPPKRESQADNAPAGRTDERFAMSVVRESRSGAIILKLVNGADHPKPLRIELAGGDKLQPTAECHVLTGDPLAVDDLDAPNRVTPQSSTVPIKASFVYDAPAYSLTVLRLKPR